MKTQSLHSPHACSVSFSKCRLLQTDPPNICPASARSTWSPPAPHRNAQSINNPHSHLYEYHISSRAMVKESSVQQTTFRESPLQQTAFVRILCPRRVLAVNPGWGECRATLGRRREHEGRRAMWPPPITQTGTFGNRFQENFPLTKEDLYP